MIGIPHRLVIGDRGLAENALEYKGRRDTETRNIALNDVEQFVQTNIPRC
ncbi:MAG TPA: His/Gly/Thr/Pro-type tRNA ligase C-terminal domain-containing protein [Spongiibacteraceae bacterium]|nr:His/Gly/Thr/Pro-type tRNA ligase C-terminal domain-containing protein [Spongiibacteraceae bacterium]